jgi:oxepin-CoA hydrolase/3-oxo-5,6-dehydrosuberyl-CoA semialdehyde dehydrogenase
MTIPFDVNDDKLREAFFEHHFSDALASITEQSLPQWGNMTAQHMVEHLLWAFSLSTGGIELPCHTPPHILERTKRFLYDNRPTPHHFKNPAMGETPPPLQFSSLAEAKIVLVEELKKFKKHFIDQPDAVYVHPIFGPLNGIEWHRAQYKHCYHHLLQFGIIGQFPNL